MLNSVGVYFFLIYSSDFHAKANSFHLKRIALSPFFSRNFLKCFSLLFFRCFIAAMVSSFLKLILFAGVHKLIRITGRCYRFLVIITGKWSNSVRQYNSDVSAVESIPEIPTDLR